MEALWKPYGSLMEALWKPWKPSILVKPGVIVENLSDTRSLA